MFDTVSVDFRRPFPIFPLPETMLLPHGITPLHIFEPRYIQMVSEAMDSRGQIAMATWADLSPDAPAPRPVLPMVCLGQIVQYERVQSGYEMLLHGLCRARVETMIEPSGDRLYRMAALRPLQQGTGDAAQLQDARGALHAMLRRQSLRPLERLETVANWFDMADVPTGPLVDLAGSAVLGQPEQRYALLAEPNPCKRAGMVLRELQDLERLLRLAALQPSELDGRICVN